MKTKKSGILILFLCIFCVVGCDNDEKKGREVTDYKEYILTVASRKVPGVLTSDGHNYLTDVYAVKKELSDEWIPFGNIEGFDFEEKYECKIKISETSYLDYGMGEPAWTEYERLEVISKEKKDSEEMPLHFIPKWYYENRPLPQYRYAIESENKELIEEVLKANPILPLDYHYLLYRDEDNHPKGIAIKDDDDLFGPSIIKSTNRNPEEMPESYKLLPPEEQVQGFMEWTFSDESGNATDYPSFDVFVAHSSRSKSVGPAPDLVCLYKDLTEHYKNQYLDAGVKTVVVSFTIDI